MRLFPAALALLALLVAPAFAQVRTVQTLVCDTPIPEGAKVEYVWLAERGLTLTPSESGREATPSGNGSGALKLTIDGVLTWYEFTVGDAPEPPQPVETLRSLVDDKTAALLGPKYQAWSNAVRASTSTDVDAFRKAHNASYTALVVPANPKLEAAITLRIDTAIGPNTAFNDANRARLADALALIAAELSDGPKPPVVVPPEPVTSGKRQLVILYESEENDPETGALYVKLRSGATAKYFKDNGHPSPQILDDDLSGKWTDMLRSEASLLDLPAMFILDPKTNAILFKSAIANGTTAENIVERIRETGG